MDLNSVSKEELIKLLDAQTKRADEERKRANEERKRADEAEDLNRPTSFEEFLIACHIYITVPITVQTDSSLTIKGSITAPTGQVENPIYNTFQALAAILAARERFSLIDSIIFKNHLNSTTEIPRDNEAPVIPRTVKLDQNCIFHQVNGERNLIYIIEYKAIYKLTDNFIRSSLYQINMLNAFITWITKEKSGLAEFSPGPPPSDNEAHGREPPSSPLQSRPYYTQRCLGGLVSRLPLDPKYPNIELHKHNSKGSFHSLSLSKVLALMESQINDDPNSYRYLKKEGYFLLNRTIIQLLLMAWGGKCLSEALPPIKKQDLAGRVKQAQRELLSYKVAYLDFEDRNILWNEEIQGVIVIDFGRVKVIKSLKRKTDAVLADMPNVRRTKVVVKMCDGVSFSARAGHGG
ncbi:hypothetical protein TEQG_03081 [Trichophyton equinum CBS 127.97]|uniref:Protein kinase domain-containing protein n=1 Tax=Trichophyton equinum (strain ATCC MYA-4606 / CBS 127.97) TaxID=559882 RepID=F2PQ79_TRIEC|nr:hypothetical protein TEQG_03081 [Trichophyton equinum CBS 127.97]